MSTYFELFKEGEGLVELRFKMVCYAKKHGIKASSVHFNTTQMTVRKWMQRLKEGKGNKDSLKSKPKHVMTPGSVRSIIKEKRIKATRKRKRLARIAEQKRLEDLTE